MSSSDLKAWFLRDTRLNAGVVWLLTVLLAAVAVVAVLDGLLPRAFLAGTAAVVAVVPAVVERSWRKTVPWPLLLLTSLPLWLSVFRPSLFQVFVTGISTAGLAMLVVVVLQMVTRIRMTPRFAVFFVVIATLATAAVWAVGSAISARYLGTAFVETNDELMMVFSAALVAGLVAGVVFLLFFRRRLRANTARAQEVEFV